MWHAAFKLAVILTAGSGNRFHWIRSVRPVPLRNSSTNAAELASISCRAEELSEARCVLLLGRPGLGKTDVLREWAGVAQGDVVVVDLKGRASWEDIRRRIFGNQTVRRWLTAPFELTLLLDSLDECLLRADSLGQLLADEFQELLLTAVVPRHVFTDLIALDADNQTLNDALATLVQHSQIKDSAVLVNMTQLPEKVKRALPPERWEILERYRRIHRLRLRLACRTTDWAFSYGPLEESLVRVWSENGVAKVELLPLVSADVLMATQSTGVEVDAFLRAVDRSGAQALLTRPIHLKRLLSLFQNDSSPLPNDDLELNEQAALYSCKEWDQDRHPHLSAARRLEVASRLAAGLVICGKRTLYLGVDDGKLKEDQVGVSALVGFSETTLGQEFEVGEPEIRDTLKTELFRNAGHQELAFDHLTTAEFLAARYLRRFPGKRALDLLVHPEDPERRVVPPLREVAVWLARFNSDVLALLLERDPVLFLRSDVDLSEGQRQQLVQAWLSWAQNNRVDASDLSEIVRPERLLHAGIHQQLIEYAGDSSRPRNARSAAFHLLEALSLPGLTEPLLAIVKDASDEPWARQTAVKLLLTTGDKQARLRVIRLLEQQTFQDPEDGLRGVVLLRTWPQDLSASRLVKLLKKPQQNGVISTYRYFLGSDHFWHALKPRDLPVFLPWLTESDTLNWMLNELNAKTIDLLLEQAWPLKNQMVVREALLKLIWQLAVSYSHPPAFQTASWIHRTITERPEERRWLLLGLIERADESTVGHLRFPHSNLPPLIQLMDASWIFNQIEHEPDEQRQTLWARVLEVDLSNADDFERLVHMVDTIPAVSRRLRSNLVIDLNSEEAETLRRWYQLEQEHQIARAKKEAGTPPDPATLIAQRLGRLTEHPEEWWDLPRLLLLKPGDTHYNSTFERDIRTFPGWAASDDATRAEIIRTAAIYLANEHDQRSTWVGKEKFDFRALAGYQALYLLVRTDPTFISTLSPRLWTNWAAIVIGYPNIGEGDEFDHVLLTEAYTHAKDACLKIIQTLVLSEARRYDRILLPDALKRIQDDAIRRLLFSILQRPRLELGAATSLLVLLLQWQHQPAFELARRWLKQTTTPRTQLRAQHAARALIVSDPGGSWNELWAYIHTNPDGAKKSFMDLAVGRFEDLGSHLNEAQIAELFVWMMQSFPPKNDPQHPSGVAYDVQPLDRIKDLRDGLLRGLSQRGTLEAVRTLESLVARMPGTTYIEANLREARELFRRKEWTPLVPATLIRLASRPDSQIIRSNEQLLDALMASLERLNARLQGETPLAPLLWNEITKRGKPTDWRPKREERLSDFVRWHLETDLQARGTILNREVVIRAGEGGAEGERTDILVDVMVPGPSGREQRIGVIIEVKGQWNADLFTALDQQLVGRYLADNPQRGGLYLVGFFRCPQWSPDDQRQKVHKGKTRQLDDLQNHIEHQAAQRSTAGQPVRAWVLNGALR